MLKGIDVILYNKTQTGVDSFNAPVFSLTQVTVSDVLVAPASISASPEELNLDGKTAIYTIAIPKGDNHTWENRVVEFFGEKWQTIGHVEQGIESLVPTRWHKKIKVARYE